MDKPDLVYNTIGKESIELQGLYCFVLLASKKRKSKSKANHVSKSSLKKKKKNYSTKLKQNAKVWQQKPDYCRKCISEAMIYPWNCIP